MKIKKKIKVTSKEPYGKALNLLMNKERMTLYSPVVGAVLRDNHFFSGLSWIANKTNKLLLKYQSINETSPRIFTSKLAEMVGCKVIAKIYDGSAISNDGPLTGCMYISNGQFVIRIIPGGRIEIVRLTVAHEIIHTFFYNEDLKRPGNLPADIDEEILCEYGAGILLLPDFNFPFANQNGVISIAPSLIMVIAKKNQIPLKTVCQRFLDPYMNVIFEDWEGAILWGLKKIGKEINNVNVIPKWAVTRNAFIPLGGKCHVKEKGVIFNSFMSPDKYIEDSNCEEVDIGTLKGNFEIQTCGFGDVTKQSRYVLSIFKPK